jgi:hypothetical protein
MVDAPLDRIEFARRVLGVEPFDHQAEALRSPTQYVVPVGGRRSGKTECAQIAELHALHVHADAQWIVTGPNEPKIRQHIEEAAELLRSAPRGSRGVLDEQSRRLTLRNGSELIGVIGTAGQLRGYGRRVRGVTIEEAGFVPSGVWRDVRYSLADHAEAGVQCWLPSSPWGGPGHFLREAWERGQDGDADYASFTWPTSLNPGISADWIVRERARTNALEAMAELDGLWPEVDGEQLFPRSLLAECTAPIELPAFGDLVGPARPVLGLDWGVNFDRSAAAVLYRLPVEHLNPDAERIPRLVVIPHLWPRGARLGQVVEDVVTSRAPWQVVAPEVNGVGAMPSQEVKRGLGARQGSTRVLFHSVATTGPKKLAAFGLMRWALERGALVLPTDPDLLRELAGVRLSITVAGNARIEAETAALHDDLPDAVALSMRPRSAPGGRVECVLSGAFSTQRAPTDAEVPALDCPTVETGAGLQVPQRPALQSVYGHELTLLADVAVTSDKPPVDPARLRLARELQAELDKQTTSGPVLTEEVA